MYFLGVSCYYHDSAAALVAGGEVVAAVQEERFTRRKNESCVPQNSIDYCLSFIPLNQVVDVIFFEDPATKLDRIHKGFVDAGFRMLPKYWGWKEKSNHQGFFNNFKKDFLKNVDRPDLTFNFSYCGHHQSHAASAFFASPFHSAAVLVVDSVGEWESTSIWRGCGSSLTRVASVNYPHSLGLLYSAFTQYCGFKVDSGEYKLMGLAPYGRPIFKSLIYAELLKVQPDSSYCLNMKYFDFQYGERVINDRFEQLLGRERRIPESDLDQFYCDVASSIQAVLNEVMVKLAMHALEATGETQLCMAGGVALNCVANGLIGKAVGGENIWVQPAAGDAGCALGAALWACYQKRGRVASVRDLMKGGLLGPQYSEQEVRDFLDARQVSYRVLSEDKHLILAELLSNGKIIGLFQSRMEFGPRALGSRSIVADPRIPDAQKKINMRIKFRESFRPFAPVVLKEDAEKYFDLSTHNPYMLFIGEINPQYRIDVDKHDLSSLGESRSSLPAITHVDYSCRVQVVDGDTQPYIYSLLHAFKQITGVGCLVNTSFNVRGEPIVCSLDDALECFQKTDIDYLVYDNILVGKNETTFK